MKRYISMLKRMFFVMVCAVMFTFSMWQTPSVYTASTPTDQDASTGAVLGLVRRVLPDFADLFVFVQIPADNGRDVFEIETLNDKVVIRGNNGVSMAMGMNWYLKHHCRSHVSMRGNQLRLPDLLPNVKSKIRQVSWARHRYFLNYCAFGYSLVWWDWPKWEKLIDWMALNGINTPLSVTGTVFLGGNLDLIARESHAARVSADSGSMVGMGFVNEGLGFNPVVFDLMFEWNARRIITLWGSGNAIRDYANKEWSGMLSGFYRKRWTIYFQAVSEAMKTGKPLDAQTFRTRLLKWEDDWSNGRETYSIVPRGDSVAVARKLWKKHLKKRRQGK